VGARPQRIRAIRYFKQLKPSSADERVKQTAVGIALNPEKFSPAELNSEAELNALSSI